MSDHIAWCVELEIQPGRLDGFLELTAQMVDATANEQGVLGYQRFVTADGNVVHAIEQYEHSDAALAHLQTFQDKFAGRFSSMVSRRRFTLYGVPSPELKKLLDSFGASYLDRLGDLAYWP
jgi:quinol monooxygenase YgiN